MARDETLDERNAEVYRLYLESLKVHETCECSEWTLAAIGRCFKPPLPRQRVYQIVKEMEARAKS